ncbi:MAG: hypothetical protein KJ879_00110 [Nanoarchaeota archaeon]|nr:hypothetical protein [Nanoarchaeota archaeon]
MSLYRVLNKDGTNINEEVYRRELVDISVEVTDGLLEIKESDEMFPFAFGDVKVSKSGGVLVELIPDLEFNPDKSECFEDLMRRASVRGRYQLAEVLGSAR